eukprot:779559-Rhodomonas_salina.1
MKLCPRPSDALRASALQSRSLSCVFILASPPRAVRPFAPHEALSWRSTNYPAPLASSASKHAPCRNCRTRP